MKIEVTDRGFAYATFKDRYGVECSIQQSSLATESALWLGVHDAEPKVLASQAAALGVVSDETTGWVPFPLPPEVFVSTRMHLTQTQVAALLPILQRFVETGEVSDTGAQEAPERP